MPYIASYVHLVIHAQADGLIYMVCTEAWYVLCNHNVQGGCMYIAIIIMKLSVVKRYVILIMHDHLN